MLSTPACSISLRRGLSSILLTSHSRPLVTTRTPSFCRLVSLVALTSSSPVLSLPLVVLLPLHRPHTILGISLVTSRLAVTVKTTSSVAPDGTLLLGSVLRTARTLILSQH